MKSKRKQNKSKKNRKPDHLYTVGEIVWAKLRGFPRWPSKISSISNKMAVVEFYGDHTIAKLSTKQLMPYTAYVAKPKKQRLFNVAIGEAQTNLMANVSTESTSNVSSPPETKSKAASEPDEASKLSALCQEFKEIEANRPTIDRVM